MTCSITFTDEDGRQYRIEGECTPFEPGNTVGPAESCSPPEGGDLEEIIHIELIDNNENENVKIVFEQLFKDRLEKDSTLSEKVEAAFIEAASEHYYDYDPTDYM